MAIPRDVQKLLDKLSDSIQEAILKSIADLKSDVRIKDVVEAIQQGKIAEVLRLLNLDESYFVPLDRAIRDAYLLSGADAMSKAAAGFPRASRFAVRFEGRSAENEAWMRERSSEKIVEIISSTREAVRSVLTNGLAEGRNPRSVALDLIGRIDGASRVRTGGVIGLHSQFAGYVESARQELESLDVSRLANYLGRVRRPVRYDGAIRRAIESGRGVPADTRDRILASYSDSLLRLRAETIARTEATATLNAARHATYQQLSRDGRLEDRDVTRRWRSAGADGRTRETHTAMHDQIVVGLTEPFLSPSGARLMHPGDTSLGAGADEIVNCRCYEEIRVDHVAIQARRERGVS